MEKKITPSEFVRLWNLILSKTLLLVKTEEYLPKVVLEYNLGDVVPEHINFVIERIRKDMKFNRIVEEQLGVPVGYMVNEGYNKMVITVVKK